MGRAAATIESRSALARAWERLPRKFQTAHQFLGRQFAGCGAVIGAMPRCDFTCTGCYLGAEANSIRPRPIAEITAQLDQIRDWLGPTGNVQLTDGEVTLRAEADVIALIRYARSIGLVPMLMTHGETFRRKPGLLERLMVEGGLTEVSFHVDTTMRGRRDRYRYARTEADLDPLRDEFADLIRNARRRTGRRLECASTVTVTEGNLAQVPGIVRWFVKNADAFKMVSFQPLAEVGRTAPELKGVGGDAVWTEIAHAVGDASVARAEGWLGHPGCSRFVQGLAVTRRGHSRFVPLYRQDEPGEMEFLTQLLDRLGGTSFRLDSRGQAIRRAAGIARRHGGFLLQRGIPALWRLGRRVGVGRPHYLCIVSHHFMSPSEMRTPDGQERLAACAFQVPIDGRLESMCAVNGAGLRTNYYHAAQPPAADSA